MVELPETKKPREGAGIWRFVLWVASGTVAYLSFLDKHSIVEVVTGAVVYSDGYFLSSLASEPPG